MIEYSFIIKQTRSIHQLLCFENKNASMGAKSNPPFEAFRNNFFRFVLTKLPI